MRLQDLRRRARNRRAPSDIRQSDAMTKDVPARERLGRVQRTITSPALGSKTNDGIPQKNQQDWEHCLCTVCHELWPTRTSGASSDSYICTRCKRDKNHIKKFQLQMICILE